MVNHKIRDLAGQIVGLLTAITHVGFNEFGSALWLCKCQCGGNALAASDNLVQGDTVSCGCFSTERGRAVGKIANLHQWPRKCIHCGVDFLGTAKQKYCTRAHNYAAKNARAKAKRLLD